MRKVDSTLKSIIHCKQNNTMINNAYEKKDDCPLEKSKSNLKITITINNKDSNISELDITKYLTNLSQNFEQIQQSLWNQTKSLKDILESISSDIDKLITFILNEGIKFAHIQELINQQKIRMNQVTCIFIDWLLENQDKSRFSWPYELIRLVGSKVF